MSGGKNGAQPHRPLLKSRLKPPRLAPNLLTRRRLLEKLDFRDGLRLTVVSGAAGFGKTTLLAQWRLELLSKSVHVGWISFDRSDRDPALAVSYLAQAIATSSAAASEALAGSRLQSHGDPHESLATLLNAVSELPPFVVMIDDYDSINSPPVTVLISSLINARQDNVHLAIASSTRTFAPAAGLLTQGERQDISSEDLRFSPDEIECLVESGDAATVIQIGQMTGGWPVAVQMICRSASLHMISQTIPLADLSHEICAFIDARVISDLPLEHYNFLLETSILDEFNGDIVDAVCGRDDSWAILKKLQNIAGLLTPIRGKNGWFLLNNMLRAYLAENRHYMGERRIQQLQMAASKWFSARGFLRQAVLHAILSGDASRTADLIEEGGAVWIAIRYETPLLREVLGRLPSSIIDERPRLRVARSFLMLKDGLHRLAGREIDDVRTLIAELGEAGREVALDICAVEAALHEQSDRGVTISQVQSLKPLLREGRWSSGPINEMLCWAHIRAGDVTSAMDAGLDALRVYEEFNSVNGRVFARIHLAYACLISGRTNEAENYLLAAEALALDLRFDPSTSAIIQTLRGGVHYERGDGAAAWDHCFGALSDLENGECWVEIFYVAYTTLSLILLATGALDQAKDIVSRGLETARRRGLERLKFLLDVHNVGLDAMVSPHQLNPVDYDVCQAPLSLIATLPRLEHEAAALPLFRIALAQGRMDAAKPIIDGLYGYSKQAGRLRTVVKLELFRALAAREEGNLEVAAEFMRRALIEAAREGLRSVFLEEAALVRPLLSDTIKFIRVALLDSQVVALVADILSVHITIGSAARSDPRQILNAREREVLAGLCQGWSNKEIGRALCIGDDAIKYHLKKIYARLGVTTRGLAVEVANTHGLLG